MSRDTLLERYGWWAALNHGGMLIAPSKLAGRFAETIEPLPEWRASRLRRDVQRARDGSAESVSTFLDSVFEDLLGLPRGRWIKGSDVSREYARSSAAGEALRPARVWIGDNGAKLPVFYPDAASGGLRVPASYRLGVGRGRRAVVRVVEWLRKANEKVALLVTGRQIRLVHAGADYEAFCEWHTDLWFQEGGPGPQVDALRLLLSTTSLTPPKEGTSSPLLAAIEDSRKGQAELSATLGERVRQAVELLIQASGPQLVPLVDDAARPVHSRDVYLAATRLVMRCVVVLFAEARELLPRTNPIYEQSYGLQALRVELERQSGGRAAERLRTYFGAWPRLLGLFSLLFHGSEHEALPLTRYGGGLFEPGDATSDDPVARAIAAFERAEVHDADVQRILELLTRCPTRVRQGKGSTTVQTPVDFSDLGSEYLGILYEGLLDYELKRVGEHEAMIFLGIGSEPALPFSVLNAMSNDELADLLKKLGKATKAEASDDEAEEDDDAPGDDVADEATDADDVVDEASAIANDDDRGRMREAVQDWAERAVKAAKLEPYPRKDLDARVRDAWAAKVTARAKSLVRRLVLPGEWYLVRWGGTRKGSGTFYTRPQLAGPIVRRTLAPLCFEEVDPAAEGASPKPRTPEEILAIKVCDPAMGSGSFLVSALRYLTDALLQSLYAHGRLQQHGDRWYVRLADGSPLDDPSQETLPAPKDDDDIDDLLRARLKRHIVERCLYGVDLDALAVELARTALWVETMDYQLPFGFLDHKLKCGNALVGGWLDRFEDYPIRAWDREAGDAKHTNFVRHFREEKGKRKGDVWNAALKLHRERAILPPLKSQLTQLADKAKGQVVAFTAQGKDVPALHAEALAVFEELHGIIPIFDSERRAEIYKTRVLGNPALQALREALDTWCAIWFWPGDKLESAPTPDDFLTPLPETRAEVRRIAGELRFFHWEVEFPDVMTGPTSGFSAIVGNPPWETQKPNSMEFFSNEDPLYRTYGKQEALKKQTDLFRDREDVEEHWVRYNARFKALSNWTKFAAFPFGSEGDDGDAVAGLSESQLAAWHARRGGRTSFSDRGHPFRHQGSADINTYKMFLEVAHALLRVGGGFGFLVPSGLYTDNGSQALRNLFLDRCEWTHLYAFQNERFVFEGIDHRFKMVVVHVRKGGRTTALLTRFRIGPGDSPESTEVQEDLSDDRRFLSLPKERITRFSPATRSMLELRSPRDLSVLEKLYATSVLLGDKTESGWGITYAREFDMTNDSALFPVRPKWEADGYKADEYGHWLKGPWKARGAGERARRSWNAVRSVDGTEEIAVGEIEGVALPLEQGGMLHQFDYSQKGWVSGTGLRAVWSAIPWSDKRIAPQFLVALADLRARNVRLGFRDIARATDERTTIAALVGHFPCGNKVPTLTSRRGCPESLGAVLNSFAFDFGERLRQGATSLNYYVVAEQPLVDPNEANALRAVALRLDGAHVGFAGRWSERSVAWRRLWAITPHERLRLRAILDAAVAHLYGLDEDDFAWILRDCDHPVDQVCNNAFARTLDPKGFWRVDKEKAPELRHPVLALVAFHALKTLGLEAFLALEEGDGWQLPETLRLADYGLGHDARAQEPQPVAAALGERFLDWQLGEDVEASWEECRQHAKLIGRIMAIGAPESAEGLVGSEGMKVPAAGAVHEPGQVGLFGEVAPAQMGLFAGGAVTTKKGRKK